MENMDGQNHTGSSTFRRSFREIKLRYLWTWLADQLGQSGLFRRFFVKGNAWGAFSIYSHIKRSDGKPKTLYPLRPQAQKAANKLSNGIGVPFTIYKCLFCDGWHVVKDSSAQMATVLLGHIPEAMEDHWFMYCANNLIHYHRGWTGLCIFEAAFEESFDGFRVSNLTINQDPEQCRSEPEKATALFCALLMEECGGDAEKYWEKYLE